MLKVPKNKIMIALLDEEYYFKHKSYPEEYNSRYAHESYVFDTPQEFIEKWYEIDEGAWYWVFDNGEVICSGAVDPDDIETFEEHFNMTFEEDACMNNEEDIKNDIENVLRQMCFGRSREWSESMVNRIYNTNVIYDKCIEDHINIDQDIIITALMEIVFEDYEYEEH